MKASDKFSELDYFFMRKAIALAKEGNGKVAAGPFGAVIVRDGIIVAEGFNVVSQKKDCTQHAELAVIQKACKALGRKTLEECTLYTSCEPCMMCLGAIKWSNFKFVYFGASAEDAKKNGFVYSAMYYASNTEDRHKEFRMRQFLEEEAVAVWK